MMALDRYVNWDDNLLPPDPPELDEIEMRCPLCGEPMECRLVEDGKFYQYRHASSVGTCGPGPKCPVKTIILSEGAEE
jgi:hypothetical protein